jgi:putative ABC transport system permease protein
MGKWFQILLASREGRHMLKNYFTIALRSLVKQRLFTALNLVGLAVGMAACLMVMLWVRNETTYEQWLPDIDRLYAVQSQVQYPGKPQERWPSSQAVMLPKLAVDFPEIEAFSRVISQARPTRLGERLENQPYALVDKGFFDVFAFPLAAGTLKDSLAPNQLVVTPKFIQKWLPGTPPEGALGKAFTLVIKGEKREFRVAAVLRDLPSNTAFNFEALTVLNFADIEGLSENAWGAFSSGSFVKLKPGADPSSIHQGAEAFVKKHVPQMLTAETGFFYRPALHLLKDLHLKSPARGALFKPKGDATLVAALSVTGLLILLIAVVTYINLATARVSVRAREVGLRKTLGAERPQLVAQFLVESTLLAACAGLLGLALVELAIGPFNQVLKLSLALNYFGVDGVLWPLALMVLFVGLAGGWYPALVLAKLRPREALSGQRGPEGAGRLRQGLVLAQFCVAIALMTCMAVIYMQTRFLLKADLGYQPEGLLVIRGLRATDVATTQMALMERLRKLPGTVAVTRAMFDPTHGGMARQGIVLPGKPSQGAPQVAINPIDWDYLATYGGRIIAGRDFDRAFANDDMDTFDPKATPRRGANVLVNRSIMPMFEVQQPSDLLGKTFGIGEDGLTIATIVGVVDDIRIRSARDPKEPAFYMRTGEDVSSIGVRFSGVPAAQYRTQAEAAWRALWPDVPFSAKLADEAISGYYENDRRRGQLFGVFATIAIVLCALGVYGLAVFTAERRTREIGIRKVLGASTWDIVRLLLMQFARPVLLAMLIAWPIAWWLMRDWLSTFDIRIGLTPWPFLAAGLAALAIAWITVAGHAIRVARQNPVLALKFE